MGQTVASRRGSCRLHTGDPTRQEKRRLLAQPCMLLQKHRKVSIRPPIYFFCFRFEEALFDFDKAITLEGSNSVIYSNRGLVNRKMERFAAAIQDYSNEINFSQNTNL